MRAFAALVATGLRLNARNRMALLYGYLFPLLFLLAFWVIYRHEEAPLRLHMGALLTVTILGGACFGLPTTLVSERERGVWRRYRLAPVSGGTFVAATLVTRYLLLLSAAALQLAAAFAAGMGAPSDPLGLFAAFTVAAVAFLGLGLVIAAVAGSVPAVQALGQCLFLPMLMIGGVAVPLAGLPGWAQALSAFLPGRYAVEAMQASLSGGGIATTGFALAALALIGAAGTLAGTRLFRWDARQQTAFGRGGLGWLAVALGTWLAVGVAAVLGGRLLPAPAASDAQPISAPVAAPAIPPVAAPPPVKTTSAPAPPAKPPAATRLTWREAGPRDYAKVAFDRLPPDSGIIAPIAASDEAPDPAIAAQVARIRAALVDWPSGKAADPVQRVRNLLAVAAVPDVLQMEQLERFVPVLIDERLRADLPAADLPRLLYWIGTHPNDGHDAPAIRTLDTLGLPKTGAAERTVRVRIMIYALKLLGRRTGAIVQQ